MVAIFVLSVFTIVITIIIFISYLPLKKKILLKRIIQVKTCFETVLSTQQSNHMGFQL